MSTHFDNYRSNTFYDVLDLKNDPKAKDKFIKNIERIVRTSLEYRNFIKYLKQDALLNYCHILNKIPEEILKDLAVEIHHHPITLYDITKTVLNKYVEFNRPFTRLSIANEIMELHYSLKVGLVPLTLTAHQLIHTDNLAIDVNNVFGAYKKFILEYAPFIDEYTNENIAKLEEISLDKDMMLELNKHTLKFNDELFNKLEDSTKDNEVKEEPTKVSIEQEFTD